jgi:hypothetical protein
MTPTDFALSMTRDLLLPDTVAPHIASSIEAQLVQARSVALPTAEQMAADAKLGPVLLSVLSENSLKCLFFDVST